MRERLVCENDYYINVVCKEKIFDNSVDSTTPSLRPSVFYFSWKNTGIPEKDYDDVISTHDISNQSQAQAVKRPEHEEFQLSQVEEHSQLSTELSINNDGIREVLTASETEQPTTMRQARLSQERRHVKESNDDKSLNFANIYRRRRHSEIQSVRNVHNESVLNRQSNDHLV